MLSQLGFKAVTAKEIFEDFYNNVGVSLETLLRRGSAKVLVAKTQKYTMRCCKLTKAQLEINFLTKNQNNDGIKYLMELTPELLGIILNPDNNRALIIRRVTENIEKFSYLDICTSCIKLSDPLDEQQSTLNKMLNKGLLGKNFRCFKGGRIFDDDQNKIILTPVENLDEGEIISRYSHGNLPDLDHLFGNTETTVKIEILSNWIQQLKVIEDTLQKYKLSYNFIPNFRLYFDKQKKIGKLELTHFIFSEYSVNIFYY